MNETDRVLAKCERLLIPFMGLLYLVSSIDRLNVGFAALTMNRDLGFSPAVFGLGAGIFFIGYSLFQVPANLVLVRVGARRWIFSILAVWGAISAACAFVRGPTGFYVLRFLLGVAEAGLFPAIVLYLTFWFPQNRRARQIASFMAASPFAFIIGGPIASLILTMDGLGGFHGWQWLFLLEGLPACLLGFVVLKLVPDGPADAAWLTSAEKNLIAQRLAEDRSVEEMKFLPALGDTRLYALGLAYLAIGAGGYGIRVWLPQIVQDMGFSNFANGFVVALPYAVAMGAMIVWGHLSDKKAERIWHVVWPTLLAAFGFVVASFIQSDIIVLFALTLVVLGLDAVIGPFWSLPSAFLRGSAAAGGIALINSFGTGLGGALGSYLIGYIKEATGGYALSMAVLALLLLCACVVVLGFGRAHYAPMVRPKT